MYSMLNWVPRHLLSINLLKNKMKVLFTTLLLAATLSVAAQVDTTFVAKGNPIVNYKYLGDPAALVHDGTLYIYAGHDECPAPKQFYLMNLSTC